MKSCIRDIRCHGNVMVIPDDCLFGSMIMSCPTLDQAIIHTTSISIRFTAAEDYCAAGMTGEATD